MNLLIFIPCLNEEQTIAQVIHGLPKNIQNVNQIDVLVVNDGSTDRSAEVSKEAGAIVISHKKNSGVGVAFKTALDYAITQKYDLMVNIDADGQFDSNDIPRLLQPILEGRAEFVSGSRFLNGDKKIEHMSAIKMWGNGRMTALINRLMKKKFTDVSCGFRAYSREAMLRLNLHGNFTYTQESFMNLAVQGLSIAEIPIKVKYFEGRQSRVAGSILQYAIRTSNIIFRTYRDYRPLSFFFTAAGVLLAIGSIFLMFLFIWWLKHGRFSPHIWSGFVGGAFVFSAQIAFVIGILADMFVRIRTNQENILYLLKKGKD